MASSEHLGGTTNDPAVDGSLEAATGIPDDETNPSLPQNWSNSRKWLIVIALSLMSLMAYGPNTPVIVRARFADAFPATCRSSSALRQLLP